MCFSDHNDLFCFNPYSGKLPLVSVISVNQCKSLIFVLVLFWHIVFRELSGLYFALVGIGSILHAADGFSFRILALFDQLFHAFRIVIALA